MHLPGIRDYTFPQQSDLPISSYPDVTRNQQIYVKHIIAQIENEQKKYGESIAKILAASRFPTNQIWDLKKQPGIPKPGEWAIYKGKLVHDAYLANHVFGEAAAKLGLSKEEALSIANTFSKISRRGMDDQPEDQAAILSGWLDFHTGNPWPKNLKTPKEYEAIKRLKNHFKVRKEKT